MKNLHLTLLGNSTYFQVSCLCDNLCVKGVESTEWAIHNAQHILCCWAVDHLYSLCFLIQTWGTCIYNVCSNQGLSIKGRWSGLGQLCKEGPDKRHLDDIGHKRIKRQVRMCEGEAFVIPWIDFNSSLEGGTIFHWTINCFQFEFCLPETVCWACVSSVYSLCHFHSSSNQCADRSRSRAASTLPGGCDFPQTSLQHLWTCAKYLRSSEALEEY